ncbi:MAG: tetratricopeptide repeat protein, partial [candidate division Zixibacteria bacterium]
LVRRRGKWFIEPNWEKNVRVPEGILSLLNRKLKRLSNDQMLMAGTAAVLGRSFYDQEIIDLSPVEKGRDTIKQLIGVDIFARQMFGQDEKIYFRHGQLRRAAYDSLSESDRREMHIRVAGYYANRNESNEFLGRHHALGGDDEKGYQHLSLSAQAALRVLAFRQAADLYAASLKCAEALVHSPKKSQRLYKMHLGRGLALNFISPRAAKESLEEAVSIAQSGDNGGSDFAEAAVAAGRNSLDLGESDRALELLQKGLSAAESAADDRLQGEAKVGLGFVYDKVGRLDDAEESYLEALDLFAGIDYPEGSCRVLNYLGIAHKRRGDLAGAEDFYRRALDICLKKNFKWAAMNLYGNLGNLYSAKGQTEEAGEHYTRSLEISRQISDRRTESINLLNIGHALNQTGDLEAAENKFFEALDKQRALGDRGSEAITLNNLGFLYFRKGEIRSSIDHYEKGLKLSLLINQPRIELANRIGITEDLTAIADFHKADEAADVAVALAEKLNDAEQLATILPVQIETKYEIGDMTGALDSIKKFLNLPMGIGEPRQRIKALLISECFKNEAEPDHQIIEKQIDDLLESNPSISAIITRFRAQFALREAKIANPEIWIARLDEAIRKSNEYLQHSETVRLMALKIKFLAMTEDSFEIARQRDVLGARIAKLTLGLDERYIRNLNRYLGNLSVKQKGGDPMVGKVSREERLEVLFRVARTINTIRESDPLLNKIMDLALETLSAERGFMMLHSQEEGKNPDSEMLEPVVARNLAQKDIFAETTISRSSAMDVARTGKPLLLSRSDENIPSRQSVVDFKISSLLCVPLAVKGRVLGIVYIDSRSGTIFTDEDLEFMVSFADLAAIAIENARLSEKLERKQLISKSRSNQFGDSAASSGAHPRCNEYLEWQNR